LHLTGIVGMDAIVWAAAERELLAGVANVLRPQ